MSDTHDSAGWGYRIIGPCTGERRLIDWHRAFAAYSAADARAGVEREAYLSAFTFGGEFAEHLRRTRSTRGYAGSCWAPWLWFDLDRDESSGGIEAARRDAAALVLAIEERFAVDPASLLMFYSGSKGFHVGLPTASWSPEPSADFHRIARRFCEALAASIGIVIDSGVYDAVRAFRAPNSKHPKTGRHKRRFSRDELLHLDATRIVELTAEPLAFDLADLAEPACGFELPADWNAAAVEVRSEAQAAAQRRADHASGDAAPHLNRLTLDFIREGADNGDRHRLLYSAARNLAEFDCPAALAHALLAEAALDCGLPPADVRRQIDCGLKDGGAA